jgi:DNA-binding transcriptional LysR family regulator
MTLEQLRIFVAVAEREHMTRAAADLHLTQSATSAAIAALETRYDTKLFDRIGRRIELTAAGRLFLDEARAVLARAAAAESLLNDLSGLRKGALALAASQTVANYWLPPVLHDYQSRFPGVALSMRIGNTQQVAEWVREASADIGVIEGAIEDPLLHACVVADDDLVLCVAPHHPWAQLSKIEPGMLKDSAWVVREAGSGTRAVLEEWLPALPVALTLPSNESVRSAVAAGAGATVISRVVVAQMLKAGTLVALDFPLPKRHFYALRHKERHVTRARQAFDQLLQERLDVLPR